MICSISIVLFVLVSVTVSQNQECSLEQFELDYGIEDDLDRVEDYKIEMDAEYKEIAIEMEEALGNAENLEARNDIDQMRERSTLDVEGRENLYLANITVISLATIPDSCPEKTVVVYRFWYGGQYFWVPYAKLQGVYYVECLGWWAAFDDEIQYFITKGTKRCRFAIPWIFRANYCVKSAYVPVTFWAYSPGHGFQLFRRKFPRCCVCRAFRC